MIIALAKKLNLNENDIIKKYIDFVALATAADIVPLIDENRKIIVEGLYKINNEKPAIA